jgi:regulator of sigma E protease
LIGIKEFQVLLTVVAFIVALGVLIAVHEWGHYRVAVACGVKVLRYSVGFGKPLLRWVGKKSGTEYVIAALPLGGYVRMLDEREGEVRPEEKHLAFNNQPLRSRAAIVAAGPAANLVLAVALLAVVNWVGTNEPAARLAAPPEGRCCIRPVFKAATGCSVPLWVARNGSLCVPWVICAGW